ncbi:hypothetical protein CFC21_043616 [Triticum aestivum]|uniref:KIB1-4 beta-propeller domain-containing protein n=2 Tax=Triticum aestivum TaxID=4565 RepID=A0A3B6FV19_WHEAT|nr:hypothetical protein CFC21_043616 [Triticum aestivum]
MASSEKLRPSTSPSATTTTTSSSTNHASSLGYFLPELIPLVASRLTTLQDFFALRAACRTYRELLPLSPANLASQGPLLLFPRMASASGALFHVPLRRILRFRLPCTDHGLTEFYSFGCRVAIQDRDRYHTRRELRIRHLLTGERARLPDPLKPERLRSSPLFRRPRRHLQETLPRRLLLPHWGRSLASNKLTLPEVYCPRFWLAERCGELLVIVRVEYNPWVYIVFYLQSGEGKWERTTSLGGCSLFFNLHEFAGCLGPDHPAVRRDCLYFTGCSGKWSEYSLVDGSYHEFVIDCPGRTEDCGSPVWVLPSIC